MKNKKITTVFLIIAVTLVWGTIIYKVLKRDTEQTGLKNTGPVKKEEKVQNRSGYHLLLNYADPFSLEKEPVYTTQGEGPATAPLPEKTNWPGIKYNGMVSSVMGIKASITVEGKSLILESGAIFNNLFSVAKIDNDSILIVQENEKKWFKK